ncbi:hypothetical protein GW17_00038803 [Ensete ventricosum]|nr:hypothetical protein GW17_00038803 [Ensete ventricosum]
MEACRRAKVKTSELALDLGMAIRHAKEAKGWAEEVQDEAADAEDMAAKSIMKGEQWMEALCRELKYVCWQLGKVIEGRRLLGEQLSTKSEESVATQLASEKAKGTWEEENNQASEWETRIVIAYKESQGHFKARYLELEVDKDPYPELPSNAEVPAPAVSIFTLLFREVRVPKSRLLSRVWLHPGLPKVRGVEHWPQEVWGRCCQGWKATDV